MVTRFVKLAGKVYQLTFDDEAVLDTVFQISRDSAPKQLNSKNTAVQKFVRAQVQLFNGFCMNVDSKLHILSRSDVAGYNVVS